jgi:hypothetical protein
LWVWGTEGDRFEGLEGGSGLAGFVLAIVFLAWAAGVGAGYPTSSLGLAALAQ